MFTILSGCNAEVGELRIVEHRIAATADSKTDVAVSRHRHRGVAYERPRDAIAAF